MSNNIHFFNDDLFYPTIIIGVLLLVLFVWKERKVSAKSKFTIRAIVSFFAIASLVLIFLKPIIYIQSKVFEIAILTDNYRPESLDSLRKINKNISIKNYKRGKTILDKDHIPTKVFILGNGIEKYDLWQIANIPSKYIEGKSMSGISRLKYNATLSLGETLLVKGLYNLPKVKNKLFLEFPKGVKLDSVVFLNKNREYFTLKSKVKVADKFLYFLVERDSLNRVVEENPLPIVVSKNEKLKILIINSFPTFETKYLKNFLAESGQSIIVRNKITKGKFKYEFFNTKKERVRFSETYLKTLDVFIIDANSFLKLSSKQKIILNNVIKKDGLGVFIQPNKTLFKSKNKFNSFQFLNHKSNMFKANGLLKSISKYNYSFKKNNLLEPIHKNKNNIYAAYSFIGNGKIATTVAKETYSLVLSGNATSFKQFWTPIINTISKKTLITNKFESKSIFSFEDEPYFFELKTLSDKPKVIHQNKNIIPLKQSINLNNLWIGKTYPKSMGWQNLHEIKDSLNRFSFYTMRENSYVALRAFQRTIENKRHFNNINSHISNFKMKIEVNLIWFYLLFLISIGYLWIVPKL